MSPIPPPGAPPNRSSTLKVAPPPERPRLPFVLAVLPHPFGVEAVTQCFLAELVEKSPLGGVAENIVGVVDLLELRFGVLFAWVLVGVQLGGELTVLLLDLVRARAPLHSENFVKVAAIGRPS